jgi:prophage regulatory protein
MEHTKPKPVLVRSNELGDIVPYSQNHIRRLEDVGQFPKRVHIGDNRVAWVRAEVEAWLDARMGAR